MPQLALSLLVLAQVPPHRAPEAQVPPPLVLFPELPPLVLFPELPPLVLFPEPPLVLLPEPPLDGSTPPGFPALPVPGVENAPQEITKAPSDTAPDKDARARIFFITKFPVVGRPWQVGLVCAIDRALSPTVELHHFRQQNFVRVHAPARQLG